MTLGAKWSEAIAGMRIRHLDPASTVHVDLVDGDPPRLEVRVENLRNTADDAKRWSSLMISSVRLMFWPGMAAARAWIAAAWAGYMTHEALELVDVNGARPLDPHAAPYPDAPCNRGLRDGMPLDLTPETMLRALSFVMDERHARALIEGGTDAA